jgi:serine/threonine protein kinase
LSTDQRIPFLAPSASGDVTVVAEPRQTVRVKVDHVKGTVEVVPATGGTITEDAAGAISEGSTLTLPGSTTPTSVDSLVPPKDAGTAGGRQRFELKEWIAEGGMGEIWRAQQSSLGRLIAIKRAKISSKNRDVQGQERQFTAEALITAALQHPNILPVHDFSRDSEGRLCLAMKEIRGIAWSKLLHPDKVQDEEKRAEVMKRADKLSLRSHLRYFLSICNAVAYAHSQGIIHRDLKPDQVIIGDYGEVILLDWGIALTLEAASKGVDLITGTPAYMAPEMTHVPGAMLDERTDIYLLGGILYEILTLSPPHDVGDAYRCIFHASEGVVREPSAVRPDAFIPKEIERLCMRCLAKKMDDRPSSVIEVQREIEEFLTYKILELEQKDAFWEVHRGTQPSQEREVKIKTYARVQGRFAIDVYSLDTREGKRKSSNALDAEARILRALTHPFLPVIYDADVDAEGRPILLMRPYKGKDLGSVLRPHTEWYQYGRDLAIFYSEGQPEETRKAMLQQVDDWAVGPHLSLDDLIQTLLRVCDVLAYVHSFGIVHRHLRPSAIYVAEHGDMTVTDWGFALDVRANPQGPTLATHKMAWDGAGRLPPYSAPEILNNDPELVNYWTDVYGLGGILYEGLCGLPPHWPTQGRPAPDQYESLMDYGRDGLINHPLDMAPKDWAVPKGLAQLAMECLAFDPPERPLLEEFRARLIAEWKAL